MANSAKDFGEVQSTPYLTQKIVVTADTTASTVSVPLALKAKPDEVLTYRSGGAGSGACDIKVEFDLSNFEVDLTPVGGGTVDHEFTVLLKWYQAATGGMGDS